MSKEFFCRERDVYQAWIWNGTFDDAPGWVLDKVASGDIREDVGWDEGHHQGERVLLYSDGFCRDDEDEPEVDEMGIGDILTVAFTGGGLIFFPIVPPASLRRSTRLWMRGMSRIGREPLVDIGGIMRKEHRGSHSSTLRKSTSCRNKTMLCKPE